MKEGAQAQAKKDNVKLLTAAGKFDSDNASQVTAHREHDDAGRQGHPRSCPADSKAIVPAIKKARDAGVMVIALDTPTEPQDAADALFATDNFKAGELIGQYAKAAVEKTGITPKIATLDLAPGISVGAAAPRRLPEGLRHQGGRPADRRRRAHRGRPGQGPGGDGELLQKDPDINVVYTINEPAALRRRYTR